jgi:spermidine/putrescine transport system permease protein
MSTSLAAGALEKVIDDTPVPSRRRGARKPWGLRIWGWLVILWLLTKIIVMALFSFNDNTTTNGRSRVTPNLNGFTVRWYGKLFDNPSLTESIRNSLIIAVATTAICVVLGTLMGVALGRWKFRGSGSVNLLLFANIAAPEVVLGSALLTLFLSLHIPLGFLTLILAHVMLCVAYVVVTVRARMSGLDPALEEASRDLGAGPTTTFFKVTLPSIMPAVFSGGLLAFAMSIDDYIVTSFNSGSTTTFPLWVWGAKERNAGSLPPQVYVMGTVIFAVGVLVAVIGAVNARRKA